MGAVIAGLGSLVIPIMIANFTVKSCHELNQLGLTHLTVMLNARACLQTQVCWSLGLEIT